MSYEFFQRQFASVMENLLHSAVSETNKLFESALHEIKAELTCIRKENDKLKDTLCANKSRSPSWEKYPCKRDIGVQCGEMPDLTTQCCTQRVSVGDSECGNMNSEAHPEDDENQLLLLVKPEEADLYDYASVCAQTNPAEENLDDCSTDQSASCPQDILAHRGSPSPSLSHMSAEHLFHTPDAWTNTLLNDNMPSLHPDTPQSCQRSPKGRPQVLTGQCLNELPETSTLFPHQTALPLTSDQSVSTLDGQHGPNLHQESSGSQQTSPQHQPRRLSNRTSKSVYRRPLHMQTSTVGMLGNSTLLSQDPEEIDTTRCVKSEGPINMGNLATDKSIHVQAVENKRNQNQCVVCDLVLSSATALRNHWRVHMVERDSVCLHCGKIFPNTSSLRSHLPIHESSEDSPQCPENETPPQVEPDNKEATPQKAESHTTVFQDPPRRLSTRETKSVYRRPLVLQTSPTKDEKTPSKKYASMSTSQVHSRIHKGVNKTKRQEKVWNEPLENPQMKSQPNENQEDINASVDEHIYNRAFSLGSQQGTFNASTSCICGWCGQGFNDMESLRCHLVTHTIEGDHRSQEDESSIKSEGHDYEIKLEQHERQQIFPPNPHEDQLVRRSQRTSKSVYRRPLVLHADELVAGQEANMQVNNTEHHRFSSVSTTKAERGENEESYRESHVNQPVLNRFDFNQGDANHVDGSQLYLSPQISASQVTQIQRAKHQCGVCGWILNSNISLKLHQRVHKRRKVSCDMCEKTFFKKADLKVHIRKSHPRHGKYPCGVCGKRLCSTKSLARHMPIHLKKKSFSCTFCGKTFIYEKSVTRHMERHRPCIRSTFESLHKS